VGAVITGSFNSLRPGIYVAGNQIEYGVLRIPAIHRFLFPHPGVRFQLDLESLRSVVSKLTRRGRIRQLSDWFKCTGMQRRIRGPRGFTTRETVSTGPGLFQEKPVYHCFLTTTLVEDRSFN